MVGHISLLTSRWIGRNSTDFCMRRVRKFTGQRSLYTARVLWASSRSVQYEQTSETLRGVNTNAKTTSSKWITRSTMDYMGEADRKVQAAASLTSQRREELRELSAKRKDRFREVSDETDRIFDREMDRIRDDNRRRWRKSAEFFKRQGKAFTLLYISVYLGTLLVLYVGFASGFLKKEAAFEYMFVLLGTYIDRDKFYQRIEAWDTYVNFGFAFVINEMLEVFRFPLVMWAFYQFRPVLTGVNRRVKASIFRLGAAEV